MLPLQGYPLATARLSHPYIYHYILGQGHTSHGHNRRPGTVRRSILAGAFRRLVAGWSSRGA